jgi:hypothetical protein
MSEVRYDFITLLKRLIGGKHAIEEEKKIIHPGRLDFRYSAQHNAYDHDFFDM